MKTCFFLTVVVDVVVDVFIVVVVLLKSSTIPFLVATSTGDRLKKCQEKTGTLFPDFAFCQITKNSLASYLAITVKKSGCGISG